MRLKNKNGFTLIEVLVCVSLLTLLLAGFSMLFLKIAQINQAAYVSSMMSLQMRSMTERLTALKDKEGIETMLADWNHENTLLLPSSSGRVMGHYPFYTLELAVEKQKTRQALIRF